MFFWLLPDDLSDRSTIFLSSQLFFWQRQDDSSISGEHLYRELIRSLHFWAIYLFFKQLPEILFQFHTKII